jgi:hypothetical protein
MGKYEVETPRGACFLRYNGDATAARRRKPNHDIILGRGRPWRFWAANAAHYELRLDARTVATSTRDLESGRVSPRSRADLLPEQVRDAEAIARKDPRTWSLDGRARPLRGRTRLHQVAAFKRDGKVFETASTKPPRATSPKTIEPRRDLTIWGRKFPSRTVLSNTHMRVVDERRSCRARLVVQLETRRDIRLGANLNGRFR